MSNQSHAQNGTYIAMCVALTHSFNPDYEPFDIPKAYYEGSIEFGFTRGKITYFGKLLIGYD